MRLGWLLLILLLDGAVLLAQDAPPVPDPCAPYVDNHEYHIEQAGIARAQEKWETAYRHYNCAVEIQPDSVIALRGRGMAQIFRDNRTRAIEDMTAAIELDPDDPVNYHHLGQVYRFMGLWEDMLSPYFRAIELDPEYGLAYNYIGVAHFELGDFDAAIGAYLQAIEVGTDPPHFPIANLGNLYWEQGRLEAAAEQYLRAVNTTRDYHIGYAILSDIYLEIGDLASAEQYWQEYLDRVNVEDAERDAMFEQLAVRDTVLRLLPTLLILLIIGYFLASAGWRFARQRRSTADMNAPPPIPDELAPPTDTSTSQRSANRTLLVLPLLAGAALLLRRIFGGDEG